MRIPLTNNKLVAFTLAGALLTAIVAVGLAVPINGLSQPGEQASQSVSGSAAPNQVTGDAPTPNPDYTPAVQTRSGYEDEDHEGDEDEHDEGAEVEDADGDEFEDEEDHDEGEEAEEADDDEFEDEDEHEEVDDGEHAEEA